MSTYQMNKRPGARCRSRAENAEGAARTLLQAKFAPGQARGYGYEHGKETMWIAPRLAVRVTAIHSQQMYS
jgi:hypothetical protein